MLCLKCGQSISRFRNNFQRLGSFGAKQKQNKKNEICKKAS